MSILDVPAVDEQFQIQFISEADWHIKCKKYPGRKPDGVLKAESFMYNFEKNYVFSQVSYLQEIMMEHSLTVRWWKAID